MQYSLRAAVPLGAPAVRRAGQVVGCLCAGCSCSRSARWPQKDVKNCESTIVPGAYGDGPVNHLEVVMNDTDLILPLFIMDYRHKSECRCRCCAREDVDAIAHKQNKFKGLHERAFCRFGLNEDQHY